MIITETTFSELVTFVNAHPKWRQRFVKALYPDIDVAKALQDLAKTQQQTQQTLQKLTDRVEQGFAEAAAERAGMKQDMSQLEQRVERGFAEAAAERAGMKQDISQLEQRVERGFTEAAAERAEMKQDISQLKGDVSQLKGFNYESRIIQQANAIFGRFMRRGHDARNEIGRLLEEAEDNGIISEQEHDHVLAIDLLWAGKQKHTKADVVLTVEVSWRAEETDIKRAISRAETLRKMGLTALPVVAGLVWDENTIDLARQQNVVCVTDRAVDDKSWQQAIS
jgi:cell division septum initiation protein DivIVA